MEREQLKEYLLSDPDKLRMRRPLVRGIIRESGNNYTPQVAGVGDKVQAVLPTFKYKQISEETLKRELDPFCHDVLFDENLPSICVKVAEDDYREVKQMRVAIPIQRVIKNKQTMHLAANNMVFTLMDEQPTDAQQTDFVTYKQYWKMRNQDGMKYRFVDAQKSFAVAGLLYYFNYKGEIRSRIISYEDGYIICSHNDKNGDRILETIYYSENGVEYIDSYDDRYMYRYSNDGVIENENDNGWRMHAPVEHGFEEIPLITKHGKAAWEEVQPNIEAYEELYNVFNAIQKRYGWGILYIKGRFSDNARKIAGSVVLNDTSMDGSGDAKYLSPPSPQGTIDTLNMMLETIQLGSSTTFILPKDIKMSGDISGIAISLAQSLDVERAREELVEWQNVADKMVRLFKYGLSKELVVTGVKENAFTEFANLRISGQFSVWQPKNDTEFNQMLVTLKGSGLISAETGIEMNTISKPDEKFRVKREAEELNATATVTESTTINNGEQNGVV